MKKISAIILAALLMISVMAACGEKDTDNTSASSAPESSAQTSESGEESKTEYSASEASQSSGSSEAEKKQNTNEIAPGAFDIPKAETAPVIDGAYTADEWKNALEITLTNENTVDKLASSAVCQGGTLRYLWDEDALYLCADINDSVMTSQALAAGNGSYNNYDGVQVCIYINENCVSSTVGELFFFSLAPTTDNGSACIGEHFVYGNGSNGMDVPEAEIASAISEDGYVIECAIKAEAFAKADPTIKLEEDTVLILANVILDNDGANQALFVDSGWFNASATSRYTLVK